MTTRSTGAMGVADALAEARALCPVTALERVPLADLPGRVLARPVTARAPIPAFSNSAMDGYAMRAADTPGRLVLAGEVAAGGPDVQMRPGTAWRICTGAPMPHGSDTVLRQEVAHLHRGALVVDEALPPGLDVRHQGEDALAGAVLLPAGSRLAAHEVAVVAGSGHGWAWCHRRHRVAILVSGDELSAPGEPLERGRVYDINSHTIAAQVRAAGGEVVACEWVGDRPADTARVVRRLLDGHGLPGGEPPDLLVTCGGASVGPHDHLRAALGRAGVRTIVPRLGMQPGQPTSIGCRDSQAVLGLAGNPVSATICFHLFGRALLGHHDRWDERAVLTRPALTRAGLARMVRCRVVPGGVEPLPQQGLAAVSSLARAEVLAWIPAEVDVMAAGDEVAILRLR